VDMDCSNSPDVFTVDNMDVTSELKRDVSRWCVAMLEFDVFEFRLVD
jgi:hypothetical protein